jgi:hypothetical protein
MCFPLCTHASTGMVQYNTNKFQNTNDIPELSSAAQPWSLTGTARRATDVSAVVPLDG